MSNLLSSLITSAGSMQAFDRALNVIQNNVSNSTTPGFTKRRQSLDALLFDPAQGFSGGVLAGKMLDYRSDYAERSVRREQQTLGRASQQAADLASIEPLLSIADESGIPAVLTRLFQSFSTLSVSPNSISARQGVLDRARQLVSTFNHAASNLRSVAGTAEMQLRDAVGKINALAEQVRAVNDRRRQNSATVGASGPDAQLYNALESLAELVDFTAIQQDDGTVTVLVGGQVPLVLGDKQYELGTDFSNGVAQIVDAQGTDISGLITGGRISTMLETRNTTIPALLGDLDTLAAAVADRVNLTLAEGVDLAGVPPWKNLFVYSDQAAVTLTVGDILPEELAAAAADAPGGNGNALQLASLASSKEVDGVTFTEFYGGMAGRLGRSLATAQDNEQLHSDLLAQARQMRAVEQSVSLDEEAVQLVQFQRAYQAAAEYFRVLNDLTGTIMQLMR
jgi:flagellar hook-associated protein 1 FlgK